MAIYTVGRGRVIVALVLTSILLLTLDLRGNPVIDRIRDGFSRAMSPVEQAAEVITTPAQQAWNTYDNYDDLERENEILRQLLDSQIGAEAAAKAAIIDSNRLLALSNLPSLAGIPAEKAQVIGSSSNNIDQVVEINKGSDDGIEVGMPVVNDAGLIGKITQVNPTTSRVMLVTDPRFSVSVEILAGTGALGSTDLVIAEPAGAPVTTTPLDVFGTSPELPEAEDPIDPSLIPGDSAPEGSVPDGSVPDGSVPDGSVPDGSVPDGSVPDGSVPDGSVPDGSVPDAVDGLPTTTTVPANPTDGIEKEFGTVVGRGQGRLIQVRYLQDVPSLATFEIGDLVETAGGSKSLSPPNIPIGRVKNVVERDGVAGPLLEIELNADLNGLNIVQVVLYRSLTELPEQ